MKQNVRIARGEFLAILAAWTAFMIWVLAHAHFRGYAWRGDEPVPLVWGMPAWVVHGILLPWLASTVFTVWFCLQALKKR